MLPENWKDMTRDERREYRLAQWARTDDKEFDNDEAAQTYAANARRIIDVLNLEEPDRVPRFFDAAGFVGQYSNVTKRQMFFDYDVAVQATNKVMDDFDMDYQIAGEFYPGPLFNHMDYQSYRWPGTPKLADNQPFQAVDKEFMTVPEYDELIADPEAYLWKTYIPRVMPSFAGLAGWPTGLGFVEIPFAGPSFAGFANPQMVDALEKLKKAGELALEFLQASGRITARAQGVHGLPGCLGGFSKVPLDFVGDTLRGTKQIMMDIRRRPEKLLAAIDAFTQPAIKLAVDMANMTGNPFIYIVMHKGADSFMSPKQFDEFYMPNFKALLMGLIEEGVVPFNFVEGGYNMRLDALAAADIPAKTTLWRFDQTEMAAAKEKVGPWGAIGGNVPSSAFATGTPEDMDAHVKALLQTCAPGGGYFLTSGANIDEARPDVVHAFLAAGKKYGTYRS